MLRIFGATQRLRVLDAQQLPKPEPGRSTKPGSKDLIYWTGLGQW